MRAPSSRLPRLDLLLVLAILALLAVLLLSSLGRAAQTYADRRGDVVAGRGPDLTALSITNDATTVSFRVSFAQRPPLAASESDGWVDMLLVVIDVPPFGPLPQTPAGEWPAADYALGTHGPSSQGMVVRHDRGTGGSPLVARFAVHVSGKTVRFTVPRRALGDPASFILSVAAAREARQGGGYDVLPDHGVVRYQLR